MNLKDFYKQKSFPFYVAAFVLGLVAVILYAVNGKTVFNPKISTELIIIMSIGLVLTVGAMISGIKLVSYASYVMLLVGFAKYIGTQITYISNLLVSIDGTAVYPTFVALVILFLLSFVMALVASITLTETGIFAEEADE